MQWPISFLKGTLLLAVVACIISKTNAQIADFIDFETPTVHGLDLSPSGRLLAACNLPDGRIDLFDTSNGLLRPVGNILVGVDPVSVRFRTENELWVVNYISGSIEIIDAQQREVIALIQTGPRPTDVIFAGTPQKAFVASSLRNRIEVYDPVSQASFTNIAVLGQRPTAMAISPDGNTVYCTIKESGNHSTILARKLVPLHEMSQPGPVEDPLGPYRGQDPPPNAGDSFDPPMNPALENSAPPVGLIVKKNPDGKWRDDNNRDWTEYVSGTNAALSGRIRGWDMLDHDVLALNSGTYSVSYIDALMTMVLGIGIDPATGNLAIAGTDHLNQIRFEPKLNGTFARVDIALVNPTSGEKNIHDLNPHLDYRSPSVPLNLRVQSIGDPRGIVWQADGSRCFISGRGSDNLLVLDQQGNRIGQPVSLPEGPEALALNERQKRLYVLNRFASSISVIETEKLQTVETVRIFDPTPASIKTGRKFLYNTQLTSGPGHVACATCHVDARMDRLAWDLGNPAGNMKPITPAQLNLMTSRLPKPVEYHPMKGPMITSTLQDVIGHEPFHWRGDRGGIESFAITFHDLQGSAQPNAAAMKHLKDFLASVHFPPNPNLSLKRTGQSPTLPRVSFFSTNVDVDLSMFHALGRGNLPKGAPLPPGNAAVGRGLGGCISCHRTSAGFGTPASGPDTNGNFTLFSAVMEREEGLVFKIANFRNILERTGFDYDSTNSTAGFGFLHDGRVDTLVKLIQDGSDREVGGVDPTVMVFTNDQKTADVLAFILSAHPSQPNENPMTRSVPPSFGRQTAITPQNALSAINDFANSDTELVLTGFPMGEVSSWVYDRIARVFKGSGSHVLTTNELVSALSEGGKYPILSVVSHDTARRVTDHDLDGYTDSEELSADSDPEDAMSIPGNTAPAIEPIFDRTIPVTEPFALTVAASDPDIPAQTIVYSSMSALPGSAIDERSGQFIFTPQPDQLGDTLKFTILAHDNGFPPLTNSAIFEVTVAPVLEISRASSNSTLVRLSWISKPLQQYRLETTATLSKPDWTTFAELIADSDRTTVETNLSGNNLKYIRLSIIPEVIP
jgi:DNA-binding beta-propeller fold protein YncE